MDNEKIIDNYSYDELSKLLKNETDKFVSIMNNHFNSNVSIHKEVKHLAVYPPQGGIYSWNYFVIEDNTRVFVFNDYAVGYKDMVKKIYLYLKSKIKQQIVQETGYKTSIKKD